MQIFDKMLQLQAWGHIAENCVEPRAAVMEAVKPSSYSKGKTILELPKLFSKATSVHLGPGASSPPTFNPFTEWWAYVNAQQSMAKNL